jgi:hypothetical protein
MDVPEVTASPPRRLGLFRCCTEKADGVVGAMLVSDLSKIQPFNIPPEPPLPVLRIATPPVAVNVLPLAVDAVCMVDPLTFFIWLRT